MAKWLRDYLSFGGRRPPPQPPTPDYTESDILRAYLEQKNLDFEDPYEDADSRLEPDPAGPGDSKYDSPKHRLIKVEAADMADMARAKVLLGSAGAESEADTEYSDPFDAQPHLPPPDDGYMEPYDAQRVMSELPCRAVQLYDTPYEEQDGEPGDKPLSGQKPRQSRLPQEDERPADEYDQPWEWKKDHISKAFAVQFDSPEWERTPGPAKELRRPQPRSPHPAERVDPALPLEKQPSSQGFLHLKFARTRENQFVLGQHSGPFASVPELVLHYSSRPLPVQGAEHLALLYPVVTQSPCPGASAPCPAP
ncbi:SH2 domain-containing adapter protein D isoform X3 [Phyllostomus discolor]|uniref:SH2 domain-containing adapter protein D isoform X3 n=1 Tax=Phyllostomus discolor TaxID=89673 RepID=A0A7E6EAJ0_9CHIR|nr:SH2 domain-containing adapter protein D isoform X3 [Phyllostomus discolor]